MDKKKWAEKTRQDKLLAIRQCIEGGYENVQFIPWLQPWDELDAKNKFA